MSVLLSKRSMKCMVVRHHHELGSEQILEVLLQLEDDRHGFMFEYAVFLLRGLQCPTCVLHAVFLPIPS